MDFVTSGNKAKVTLIPTSLDKAFKLKSAVERALLKYNVKLFDALNDLTYEDLFNLGMIVDSDPDVYEACFDCMDKSIYNGVKITKAVFEDESARGDLYEVLFYCLKVNVFPFFKSLLSSLGTNKHQAATGESLKSI